jgi:hypothetical protein
MQPFHSRHPVVQQYKINGGMIGDLVEGAVKVARLKNFRSFLCLDEGANGFPNKIVIVGYQYFHRIILSSSPSVSQETDIIIPAAGAGLADEYIIKPSSGPTNQLTCVEINSSS